MSPCGAGFLPQRGCRSLRGNYSSLHRHDQHCSTITGDAASRIFTCHGFLSLASYFENILVTVGPEAHPNYCHRHPVLRITIAAIIKRQHGHLHLCCSVLRLYAQEISTNHGPTPDTWEETPRMIEEEGIFKRTDTLQVYFYRALT